jgi:hypothetical protein
MPKRTRGDASSASGSSSEPEDDDDQGQQQDQQQPQAASSTGPAGGAHDPDYGADPFIVDEEDDGEELIGEGMEADYRPMGALDQYEEDGLDDHQYGLMDMSARAAADAALDARDQRERVSRMPKALLTSDDDDGEERAPRRRRRGTEAAEHAGLDADAAAAAGLEEFFEDDPVHINLEDYQCPLAEWISSQPVGEEVRKRFRRFLQGIGFDSGISYADKVRASPSTHCHTTGGSGPCVFWMPPPLAPHLLSRAICLWRTWLSRRQQPALLRFSCDSTTRPLAHATHPWFHAGAKHVCR